MDISKPKRVYYAAEIRYCVECGKEFKAYAAHLKRGRPALWCSRACRYTDTQHVVQDTEMQKVPLTGKVGKGQVALVSSSDYLRVMERRWTLGQNGYVYLARHGSEKKASLHRFLIGGGVSDFVDHINGDRLDNRRENLRLCAQAENNRNQLKSKFPKSSKYKGVYLDKVSGRWHAQITFQGKQYYLGKHHQEIAAALAYNEKAKALFGDFAKINTV